MVRYITREQKEKHSRESLRSYYRKLLRKIGVQYQGNMDVEELKELYYSNTQQRIKLLKKSDDNDESI